MIELRQKRQSIVHQNASVNFAFRTCFHLSPISLRCLPNRPSDQNASNDQKNKLELEYLELQCALTR